MPRSRSSRLRRWVGECDCGSRSPHEGYSAPVPKRRLDTLLAERGLYETRIAGGGRRDGRRRAGGGPARRQARASWWRRTPSWQVAERPRFVSRGGIKLANALDALGLEPGGPACLDVGASTGGFTDCLLQRGAAAVIALDVAYGELHWRIRQDPRVTVVERRNARSLDPGELPYRPDLIVADVSFISLAKVLPAVAGGGRAELRLPRAGQAAVRGRPRARRQGRRGAHGGRPPRGAGGGRPRARATSSAPPCSATPRPGCPGPPATARASSGWPRPARAGAVDDLEAAARRAEP